MLNKDNAGLMIIDVQGKLAEQMFESDKLLQKIATLIQGAKLLGLPIIWMEQLPDKLGETQASLKQHLSGEALPKDTFSGWQNKDIQEAVNNSGKSQWLVAGIESHICVYQTVRDLLAANHHVYLVTDAVGSRAAENKTLALEVMQKAGAQLTSVEMVLFELQQRAQGDTFKQLLKLIK